MLNNPNSLIDPLGLCAKAKLKNYLSEKWDSLIDWGIDKLDTVDNFLDSIQSALDTPTGVILLSSFDFVINYLEVIGGAKAIEAGVTSLFFTGGLSTPVAIGAIAGGAASIFFGSVGKVENTIRIIGGFTNDPKLMKYDLVESILGQTGKNVTNTRKVIDYIQRFKKIKDAFSHPITKGAPLVIDAGRDAVQVGKDILNRLRVKK